MINYVNLTVAKNGRKRVQIHRSTETSSGWHEYRKPSAHWVSMLCRTLNHYSAIGKAGLVVVYNDGWSVSVHEREV